MSERSPCAIWRKPERSRGRNTPVIDTWSPGRHCRVDSPRQNTVSGRGILPTGTSSLYRIIYVISTVTGYKMRKLVTSKLNYYDSVGRILRCVSITVNMEKILFVQATTTDYITLARLNQLTVNAILNISSLFR